MISSKTGTRLESCRRKNFCAPFDFDGEDGDPILPFGDEVGLPTPSPTHLLPAADEKAEVAAILAVDLLASPIVTEALTEDPGEPWRRFVGSHNAPHGEASFA
jgi:hypothetical protein